MNLVDILSPELVIPSMAARDRWEAIEELIGRLVEAGRVLPEHREAIIGVVRRREASMSTGIGFGIGIPHASTDLITEVTGAFGRSASADPGGVGGDTPIFAASRSVADSRSISWA